MAGFLRAARRRVVSAGRALMGRPDFDDTSVGRRARSLTQATTSRSLNASLSAEGSQLRSRSRQLARNNVWMKNGLDSFVANAIGTGITPQPGAPDHLFRSPDQAQAFREAVSTTWLEWTDEADAHRKLDFYGLMALACREVAEAGEVIGRFRDRRDSDGLSVPLQIQLLESEHMPYDLNRNLDGGASIRCGVELSAIGETRAYWLYSEHPGEGIHSRNGGSLTPKPVPASEIMHVFALQRAGQLRGVPLGSATFLLLNDIGEYQAAELIRKKGAAHFGGVIECPDPEKLDGLFGSKDGDLDDGGGIDVTVEPGTWQAMPPGWTMKNFEPADVGPNFSAFINHELRAAAAGLGLTYEMLTGDVSQVNYSSARVNILEFRRRCEAFIWSVMVHQFCRPVWQRWMDTAVQHGRLPISRRDYVAHRREFQRVTWTPAGWQWVDPLKEVTAKILEIRAGLTSVPEAIRERGKEPSVVEAEIDAWNKRADAAGRVHDTDPRKVTQSGIAVTVDAGAEELETMPVPGNGGRRAA